MERNPDPLYLGGVSIEDHDLLSRVGDWRNDLNRNRSGKQRIDTNLMRFGEPGEDWDAKYKAFEVQVQRLKDQGRITVRRQYGRVGFLYLANDPVPEEVKALLAEHGWREPLMFHPGDWHLKGVWRLGHDWDRTHYWRQAIEQLAWPTPENRGWSKKEETHV